MTIQEKRLLFFLLKCLGLFIGWVLLEMFIIAPYEWFDGPIRSLEGKTSAFILDMLHYPVQSIEVRGTTQLKIGAEKIVGITHHCDGLVLIALYVGLLIAFPISIKNKWRHMLIGSIIIFGVNIIRIVALSLIEINYPHYLAFNHVYTFTFLVYVVIFGLWWHFVKKYSTQINVA